MSSFILVGFLGVINGRRINVQRSSPTPKSLPYALYDTAINCKAGGHSKNAEIRTYCPSSEPIYPDMTVFYTVAKAYIPNNNQPALLDPLIFAVVPGDPSSPDYEGSLPNCPFPLLFAIGTVGSISHPPVLDIKRLFELNVGEYIRDEVRSSTIRSVLLFPAPFSL